jgi:hypothetical protein
MAKRHNARGRSVSQGRYVALPHWMMKTEAWQDLDCVSRCAYIELAERYGGPGSNNGRIPCSLREIAEGLSVSKATAMRALESLQGHGFIVLAKAGYFSVKTRHAAEWRLTEFGCDVTKEMATKDFTRWQPAHQSPPLVNGKVTAKIQKTVSPENPIGFRDETERVSR